MVKRSWSLVCVSLLFATSSASAAYLTARNTEAMAGGIAVIGLTFTPSGDKLNVLVFELELDPGLTFLSLESHESANVGTFVHSTGRALRVEIMATDGNTIEYDDDLATIRLAVDSNIGVDPATIALRRIIGFGLDGALVSIGNAEASISIEASPGSRRRGARKAPRAPSSNALIDAALTSGKIDRETALIYKVYARFEDPGLPHEYRGNDSEIADSSIMLDVWGELETLSPAAQEILTPFFIPPFQKGSWHDLRQSGKVGRSSVNQPNCQAIASNNWSYVDSPNGKVRVWWEKNVSGDEARALEVSTEMSARIWGSLTGLMNREPYPDGGSLISCRGGDDRYDIALVNSRSEAIAYYPFGQPILGCGDLPSFMVLQRTAPGGIVPNAAHELMHSIQLKYKAKKSFCTGGPGNLRGYPQRAEYKWMQEATAMWAQDYVYPKGGAYGDSEQWKAKEYLVRPHQSITVVDDQHEYGAYVFFFFLHRKYGNAGLVRQIWEQTEGQADSLAAINAAVPGGLEKVWGEFAAYNVNQPSSAPYDLYRTSDNLRDSAAGLGSDVTSAQEEYTIDFDPVEPMATWYQYFKLTDIAARTVTFYNGNTFKLSKKSIMPDEGTFGGTRFFSEAISNDKRRGSKLQALVKLEGKNWELQDWTDRAWISFCRDAKSERVEELFIFWSNSRYDDQTKLQSEQLPTTLLVSNLGCYQWKGTIEVNVQGNDGRLIGTANLTLTRQEWPKNGATTVDFEPEKHIEYELRGTGAYEIAGTGDCSIVARGTVNWPSADLRELNYFQTFNYTPSGKHHREYRALGATQQTIPIVQATGDCAGARNPAVGSWWVTTDSSDPLKVQPNGTTIQGRYDVDVGYFSWTLTAQREP